MFCCDDDDLGTSFSYLEVEAGDGADDICFVDESTLHCSDVSGSGSEYWQTDTFIDGDGCGTAGADRIVTSPYGSYAWCSSPGHSPVPGQAMWRGSNGEVP